MATFASELRIAMFGKSHDDMSTLTNFISGKQDSKPDSSNPRTTKPQPCVQGEWKRKPFVIFKTKEELPVGKIKHEIQNCVAHCPPGPNILLLIVDPNDFTKNDSEKLKLILSYFDKDAFQYSMVVITQSDTGVNPFVQRLVQKCNQRHHTVILDVKRRPVHAIEELMEKLEDVVNQNRGQHLSLTETEPTLETLQFLDFSKSQNEHQTHLMESKKQVPRQSRSPNKSRTNNNLPIDPQSQRRLSLFEESKTLPNDQNAHERKNRSESPADLRNDNYIESFSSIRNKANSDPERIAKPPLNIVLCGRYGDWKTLATNAILGKKQFGLSSDCVKRQREVCGRTVSIVDLPTLCGKPPDVTKKEAFRSITLCEPEGVHAFVLVLPVGPIGIEDKSELEAIRNAYGAHVNAKTLLVFTVDSETSASAVSNYVQYNSELKNLCQSCDGRYVIFNITNKQQVKELLKEVEKMSANGSKGFTRELFPRPPVNKLTRSASVLKLENIRAQRRQSQTEILRLVMVGKTGCGKSATGNTILGREEFTSKISQTSLTRECRKVEGSVEGHALEIVDTPGLFDTALTNDQVQEELVNCISLLSPGPHAFLLVLQIGRFTTEEQETVQLIKDFFGKRSKDFIMIVFTRGDELRNTTLESYLGDNVDGFVSKLIPECRGRYQLFNNNDRENRQQVRELLHKIDVMVTENEGSYYTSEMFKEAENAIEKEKAKILKQREPEIVRQKQEIEKKFQEELKVVQNYKSEVIPKIEQEIQQSEEQLKEKGEKFKKEQKRRKLEQERREQEETIKKLDEELQRNKWKIKCENLQRRLQSEQKQTTLPETMVQSISMDEMRREWDSWERERREWWERRYQEDEQRRLEDRDCHERLCREYEEERKRYEEEQRKYEAKLKEEEQARREQEERLQEKYLKKLEKAKKENEYEARKQAVCCNEFQDKYKKDVVAEMEKNHKEMQLLRQRQQSNNKFILQQLSRDKTYRKEYNMLKQQQEQEIKVLQRLHCGHDHEDLEGLQRKHEEETHLWIQARVQTALDNKSCSIL